MKALNERLAKIQRDLNAPKSQRNNFGNYNYRSCEDILQAVKPLLDGLTVVINDDIQVIGDRVYVKATAVISDGEHEIKASAFARESLTKKGMDESQITGSTSSYARKYALNGLLLIDDNKDADSRDNRNAHKERQDALEEAKKKLAPTIKVIRESLAEGDLSTASEAWFELTDDEKQSIWVAPTKGGPFSTEERATMKTPEFRLAKPQE